MEIRYFFDEVKETAIDIKKPIFADKELYNKFIENSKNVIAIDITPEGVKEIVNKLLSYNFLLHSQINFLDFLKDVDIDLEELQSQRNALQELTKIELSKKDKDIQNERIKEFYTNLPKFEYKVLKFRDRMIIGDTKTKPMEEMLNAFARQGWKVISMVENTWRQEGIVTGNSHGEILVTMERQVFNG
ncbi:hypothetical protein LMG9449_1486 [Lactococcus lactis subsp. lactis]|uniref:DUF4177 domain-containing protein n=1 Tax=Lactococcus lactis subsp. lactis TaxID=1360 RepID=A0A0V8DWW5_LACLL|nr:DUF4177 domain-containing protein [Lactococcus lactis]KSU17881.1 hypothetical protein LMG9449_1486 [Lactococcus lactis subsp. lactis]